MAADPKRGLSRRQQQIADRVLSVSEMTYPTLAEQFGISQMTAYRDAQRLSDLGLVRRVRGGITAQSSSVFESSLQFRGQMHRAEKEALSGACLEMIEPGMSIIVDDGTTLLPLAERLHERTPVTVMTSFLPMISQLAGVQGIKYDAAGGTLCADLISGLRTDLLLLCPSAVHDGRALHQDEEMIATKRAMMRSAERRILVADHSKLGRRAMHTLSAVRDFHAVLTDDGADAAALAHVEDQGVPITLVPTAPSSLR